MLAVRLARMSDDSVPKVIFLHAPKTGGTTFRGVLQRVFPRVGTCSSADMAVLREELAGHDALEILTALTPGGETRFATEELMREEHRDVLREAEVFVMFRDPVDFVVSLFHHIGRNLDTPRVRGTYADADPGARTLEQFVADPRHANLQLSFLVGNLPFASGRLTDRSDLARGVRILDEPGLHVGLTERFADFLHVFETVVGRTIPDRTVERRNVRPVAAGASALDIDPALRRRITTANALDVELHAHARAMVERQAGRYGPAPAYVFTSVSPDR